MFNNFSKRQACFTFQNARLWIQRQKTISACLNNHAPVTIEGRIAIGAAEPAGDVIRLPAITNNRTQRLQAMRSGDPASLHRIISPTCKPVFNVGHSVSFTHGAVAQINKMTVTTPTIQLAGSRKANTTGSSVSRLRFAFNQIRLIQYSNKGHTSHNNQS